MILSFVGVAMLASSCGSAAGREAGLRVVASTSIVGDLVEQVVGDQATVEVLMPVGADPHEFRPSAQQVAAIQRADAVFVIGLGLEEGLQAVLEAAASDGVLVVEIGPQVDPLPAGGGLDAAGLDGSRLDPHVWMDPIRMAMAARLVGGVMSSLDERTDWSAAADRAGASLERLDEQIAASLSQIPATGRRIVTNHDSLRYFADRYGLEIAGTVIPGGGTLAAPGAGHLAELVARMRAEGLRVIFTETVEPSDVAEAVADEVGDVRIVELFTGSLGAPGSGADTLTDMLLTDAERIAAALAP